MITQPQPLWDKHDSDAGHETRRIEGSCGAFVVQKQGVSFCGAGAYQRIGDSVARCMTCGEPVGDCWCRMFRQPMEMV
jgi:hypothetical protein